MRKEQIFSRYRRSEQTFVLGLMEMVVNGVSTRKVSEIAERLCGAPLSKSTVSRIAANLDARVNAFLSRRLDDIYAFVIVDALFTKSRCGDHVTSKAVLVVGGATWQRCRIHLLRNMLGHCPRRDREDVATGPALMFKAILVAARRYRDESSNALRNRLQDSLLVWKTVRRRNGCDETSDGASP